MCSYAMILTVYPWILNSQTSLPQTEGPVGSSRPWGPQLWSSSNRVDSSICSWMIQKTQVLTTFTCGIHLKDIQWDSRRFCTHLLQSRRQTLSPYLLWLTMPLLIPIEQHYPSVDYGQYIRGRKYMIHIVQPSLKMDAWRAEHCSFFATGGRDEQRWVRWTWHQHIEDVI